MTDQYFETRKCCPACMCEDTRLIYQCDFLSEPIKTFIDLKFTPDVLPNFEEETYILKKCTNCDLIYQERIFNETGMSLLYNKWLVEGDKEKFDFAESTYNRFIYFSQELLMIAKFFDKEIQDTMLLDYGMGKGQWCAVARDIGYDVTGTDVSDQLLENGRSLGLKVLPLADFSKQKYDFINTEQVFEHLSKPLEVLEQLKNALKPQGIVKISVPYGANVEKRIPHMDWGVSRSHHDFIIPITPAAHINTFSQKSIIKMGGKLGFKPVVPHSIFSEYSLISAESLRDLIRSLVRPIYRRYKKFTYVFLQV